MNEFKINNVLDLHNIFMGMRSHEGLSWWFRGQSDINWELLPKAGRKEFYLPEDRDLGRFNYWRKQAVAYDDKLPENDWECLAIAQHFGLATRLLDWSYNPMIATFFAVNENYEVDGVIYGYQPDKFVDTKVLPLKAQSNGNGFIPRVISSRILNQKSLFTVHGPADSKIIEKPNPYLDGLPNLFRITIQKELKKDIQNHIADYGFTYSNMFPDLEGLSKHINWDTIGIVNFRNRKRHNPQLKTDRDEDAVE
jgi:hypothetical protein